jgi:hypothetical protein
MTNVDLSPTGYFQMTIGDAIEAVMMGERFL